MTVRARGPAVLGRGVPPLAALRGVPAAEVGRIVMFGKRAEFEDGCEFEKGNQLTMESRSVALSTTPGCPVRGEPEQLEERLISRRVVAEPSDVTYKSDAPLLDDIVGRLRERGIRHVLEPPHAECPPQQTVVGSTGESQVRFSGGPGFAGVEKNRVDESPKQANLYFARDRRSPHLLEDSSLVGRPMNTAVIFFSSI